VAINGAHKNSSDCIKAILDLHFPYGHIIDVNYGLGVFYKLVPNRTVTGIDLKGTGDIVADNKHLPFQTDTFDVGVCDPPYRRGSGNKRYENRYGKAPCTEARVNASYVELLPELIGVSRDGIIIKCQDTPDGHKFLARHIAIIGMVRALTGLDVHDIAITSRFGGPNNITNGTQRFFQQSFSYYLIWKWTAKYPFKPLRF